MYYNAVSGKCIKLAQKCCAFLSTLFAQTIAPNILQKYTFVFKFKNYFDFLYFCNNKVCLIFAICASRQMLGISRFAEYE